MTGEVKDQLQGKIRADAGKRWDEHTKSLPELHLGDTVQMQNLRGRHPLKSDHNGVVVAKHNFNSYSVKVNGTGLVTVRNRASLRKILPVVQAHNLVYAQGKKPVQGADSARSQLDRAVRQARAGPRPDVDRAGRQAGAGPRIEADRDVLQPEAGPRAQADRGVLQARAGSGVDADRAILQAEAVLRAGAELADPGLLRVLRAGPGTQAGRAESGLGVRDGTGQSTVRAGPSHTRVLGLPGGGSSPGSPRGSSHLPEGRDRSGSGCPPLGSLSPLQEGGGGVPRVGQCEAETQNPDQVAQSPPPVRRGTRVRNKTDIYQAGLD